VYLSVDAVSLRNSRLPDWAFVETVSGSIETGTERDETIRAESGIELPLCSQS
jgi:hypothetical protein